MEGKDYLRKGAKAFLGFSVIMIMADAWQGWTMNVASIFLRTVIATAVFLGIEALYSKYSKRN